MPELLKPSPAIRRLILLALAMIAMAGCGADQSREDAHDASCVGGCKTAPEVITFNNHFPNVETKCDGHGHRVYVTTHDSATGNNVLVIDDEACR